MTEDDNTEPDILALLQHRTSALVAQRLRSVSAVIARLAVMVGQAQALGHSHAHIHARLCAAGLAVSWNNYRAALVRARRRSASVGAGRVATAEGDSLPEPLDDAAARKLGASPEQLLDALANAQRAAARDYALAARAGTRKPRSSS